MPSLPGGISTCVVTFGKASGYRSDQVEIASIDAVLSADRDIVWSATGWSFRSANQSVTSDVDGSLSFAVPHVDQDGFVDRSGSGIKLWEYTLTGFIRFAGRTEAFSKDFGPLVGQTTIDLDLVADGPSTTPVLSPTEYVTSVDGQTGAVSLTDSYVARQDTGWRDITDLFDEALPATTFLIRRDTINGVRLSINPGQNGINLRDYSGNNLPVGFGCTTDLNLVTGYPFLLTDEGGTLAGVGFAAPYGEDHSNIQFLTLPGAADPSLYASCAVSWPCDEDWPTSLPGTAA